MTPTQKTATTAAIKSDVIEADPLVWHRLLLVILATFGLNRTPNWLSRISLDKSSGSKCTVASICFHSNVTGFNFASFALVLLFLVFFLAGRASRCCVSWVNFAFWDVLGWYIWGLICLTLIELQSIFSATKTTLPAQPWQSRTDPDPPCLDATELIRALLPNQYDKSCRSSLDGVGPCKRQSGNRNGCHDLSLDLSSVLS